MKFKKHIGVVAALALAVAAPLSGMTQAAADEAQNPYSGSTDLHGTAYITKQLQTINGQTGAQEFTFHFEPMNGAPALADMKVSIDPSQDTYSKSENGALLTYYKSTDDIVAAAKKLKQDNPTNFQNNGIYKYTVTETAGNTQYMTYDQNAYTLVILVSGNVMNAQVVKRAEGKPSVDAGAKVDPELKKDVLSAVNKDGKVDDFKISGMTFTNQYKLNKDKSTLNSGTFTFKKEATGLSADPTKVYEFTIKFYSPVEGALANIENNLGSATQVEKGVDGTFTVKMKASASTSFTGIQEGTLYSVEETGGTWKASIPEKGITVGNEGALPKALTPAQGDTSQNYTVDFAGTNRAIILGQSASLTLLNTWDNTNPTGLVINNLPFVLMIGIPVLVAAGYVVLRRKGVQI